MKHRVAQQANIRMLDQYSHERSLASGCSRCYGSTRALTERDREEINSMKKLTAENRLNAVRLS